MFRNRSKNKNKTTIWQKTNAKLRKTKQQAYDKLTTEIKQAETIENLALLSLNKNSFSWIWFLKESITGAMARYITETFTLVNNIRLHATDMNKLSELMGHMH